MRRFWFIPLIIYMVYALIEARAGRLCAYMGTDFRGYYASGQIAWKRSFAEVYNHVIQNEFQAGLRYTCPEADAPQPAPLASVPYLPVFLLAFLPLSSLELTTSFLTWTSLNLVILLAYLVYFLRAVDGKLSFTRFFEWVIVLPLMANLYLGQSNVWLVICLGGFFLAHQRQRYGKAGLWLAGLALKPQTLVLLIPGLVLGRNWRSLTAFSAGLLGILGASVLLAGIDGVQAATNLAANFAGPLIRTVPGMINIRALVFNLEPWLPVRLLWVGAAFAAVGIFLLIGYLWSRRDLGINHNIALLLIATLAGTFIVTWHSHFYLLVMLLPLLIYLDSKGLVPWYLRTLWSLGPLVLGALLYFVAPGWLRPGVGMSYLALSILLMLWSARRLQWPAIEE